MPRRNITLAYDEGRDSDGLVHKAIKPGLWMNAQCNNIRIGTNETGIREYCEKCFPEITQRFHRKTKTYVHKPIIHCEEIPENDVRPAAKVSGPKPPKIRLRDIKSVDNLLRKYEINRRQPRVSSFDVIKAKLKDS